MKWDVFLTVMRKKTRQLQLCQTAKGVFFSGPLGKKKKSANDLFILIYSVCFFFFFFLTNPVSSSHYRSFLKNARCWRMEECTAALGLKAERYGAVGATAGRFGKLKKINNSAKLKLRRTCWLWVKRRLVSAKKKKWFLWPVCTDGTCCMNVLWMYKRVSNFVCAYHLHYIVMAYLFLRRKKNIKAIQISYIKAMWVFIWLFVSRWIVLKGNRSRFQCKMLIFWPFYMI